MKIRVLHLAALAALSGFPVHAADMASIAISPATGVVTLTSHWSIGANLSGFHYVAQDLSLGGGPSQFYSVKGTAIPAGGDISAFVHYLPASGAAMVHTDIGSKLTPNSYTSLTSADPDLGYGEVQLYFIHHKSDGDYFAHIVPGSGASSAVADLKPMSQPGGPSTGGLNGYLGLTFAASDLGYGANVFYYLRKDSVTGFATFGSLVPALAGTSTEHADLGIAGYNALAYTPTDVGYGMDQLYYERLDPITGFSIIGRLNASNGHSFDIANLGSVFTTLTFVVGNVGFGTNKFYTTGAMNPSWQSVSFAAMADRSMNDGPFTVSPSASSGLPIILTVVAGSTGAATIAGPVAGVFVVTPTASGRITLQATQVGQSAPTAYEFNMLRQGISVGPGSTVGLPGPFVPPGVLPPTDGTIGGGPGSRIPLLCDFNRDGHTDILFRNSATGRISVWLMKGKTILSRKLIARKSPNRMQIFATGDFNRDGRTDILWRNVRTGKITIWFMRGTHLISKGHLLTKTPNSKKILAAGDLNGDGRTDLVWQKSGGSVGVWLTSGKRRLSSRTISARAASGEQVVGTGDFSRDGQTDILVRNPLTGEVRLWVMSGTTFLARTTIGNPTPAWKIETTGDFNHDGNPDILLRGKAKIRVWLMKATTILSKDGVGRRPVVWQIKN